ncbi:uncharacterized protein LOC112593854 [Melanaphis sacchari]|uniref:uncharacterized protein LOC112593854 n=1 Tax=Melanaphis sacchari TaxID=742174 RepID=UPI000DC12DDB|nr:uncharacterized protein LOC112593854 [Melanaphis sacchari]
MDRHNCQFARDPFLRGPTTGQKEPSGKVKQLIVLHIGSSDGFVPKGLLSFESKKNTLDYHDEMNGDTFYDWFIKILPSLKNNANSLKKYKPLHEEYIIDEVAKEHDKIVLRLPPYHCELNPIELAWSWIKNYVRMNNTTFKLQDVQELLKKTVDNVTSEMWMNFISHVIKEEDKFWKIDFLSDDVLDAEPETTETSGHLLTITGDTTSDSDDENI